MNYLIDDITRILASPTPRRKTFKLIGGALAAGLFGSVTRVARGATICTATSDCSGQNQSCCGNTCNASSEFCCPNGVGLYGKNNNGFCPPTQCCRGVCCCPPGSTFVNGATGVCTADTNGYCTVGAPGSNNNCQTGG